MMYTILPEEIKRRIYPRLAFTGLCLGSLAIGVLAGGQSAKKESEILIEEKVSKHIYDDSQVYLRQVSSARDFFLLSENNLASRVLLLEDDLGTGTWDIATAMFQRKQDLGITLGHSLTNGSYSGVSYPMNQVPSRALNDSYSDEQKQDAFNMIIRLQNHKGRYRTDGGDSFFHRDIPSGKYTKEEILYLANFDDVFRETYNLPKGSKERMVEIIPHSHKNGEDKVLFIYDAH